MSKKALEISVRPLDVFEDCLVPSPTNFRNDEFSEGCLSFSWRSHSEIPIPLSYSFLLLQLVSCFWWVDPSALVGNFSILLCKFNFES